MIWMISPAVACEFGNLKHYKPGNDSEKKIIGRNIFYQTIEFV